MNSIPSGMFLRKPPERSSRATTLTRPRSCSDRISWDPIKPAAPVTRAAGRGSVGRMLISFELSCLLQLTGYQSLVEPRQKAKVFSPHETLPPSEDGLLHDLP